MVGPEYEVGMNGRNSDGGDWAQSPLNMALEDNILDTPKPTPSSDDSNDVPYALVGDKAFPLSHYTMKLYPEKPFFRKRIFKGLSRARRILENFLGILDNCGKVFPFLLKLVPLEAIPIESRKDQIDNIFIFNFI